MAHIETIEPEHAEGAVARMYDSQRGTSGVPLYARLFCHNPRMMSAWADLLNSVKSGLDKREFLLVNYAVALAVDSGSCTAAFAGRLSGAGFSQGELTAIARGSMENILTERERAIVSFAVKVARDSARITGEEVDVLRQIGLEESEIFHVAAAAASRCFFARLCDGLGA